MRWPALLLGYCLAQRIASLPVFPGVDKVDGLFQDTRNHLTRVIDDTRSKLNKQVTNIENELSKFVPLKGREKRRVREQLWDLVQQAAKPPPLSELQKENDVEAKQSVEGASSALSKALQDAVDHFPRSDSSEQALNSYIHEKEIRTLYEAIHSYHMLSPAAQTTVNLEKLLNSRNNLQNRLKKLQTAFGMSTHQWTEELEKARHEQIQKGVPLDLLPAYHRYVLVGSLSRRLPWLIDELESLQTYKELLVADSSIANKYLQSIHEATTNLFPLLSHLETISAQSSARLAHFPFVGIDILPQKSENALYEIVQHIAAATHHLTQGDTRQTQFREFEGRDATIRELKHGISLLKWATNQPFLQNLIKREDDVRSISDLANLPFTSRPQVLHQLMLKAITHLESSVMRLQQQSSAASQKDDPDPQRKEVDDLEQRLGDVHYQLIDFVRTGNPFNEAIVQRHIIPADARSALDSLLAFHDSIKAQADRLHALVRPTTTRQRIFEQFESLVAMMKDTWSNPYITSALTQTTFNQAFLRSFTSQWKQLRAQLGHVLGAPDLAHPAQNAKEWFEVDSSTASARDDYITDLTEHCAKVLLHGLQLSTKFGDSPLYQIPLSSLDIPFKPET